MTRGDPNTPQLLRTGLLQPGKGASVTTPQYVQYEQRDGIGYVTLDRPEVLNALNDDVIKQLREALFMLDDDDDAQVGILSGSGRAFCSGADIKQRQMRPVEELARLG